MLSWIVRQGGFPVPQKAGRLSTGLYSAVTEICVDIVHEIKQGVPYVKTVQVK